MEAPRIDDEHNLIARYAAKLFSYEGKLCEVDLVNGNSSCEGSIDSLQQCTEFKVHQNLIDELEASNRQIMEQISHLKQAEDASYGNSNLIFELQMLKQHKGELEGRMNKLQDGRRDLMDQLERLMGLLKSRDNSNGLVHSSPLYHPNNSIQKQYKSPFTPKRKRLHSSGSVNASPKLTPQHSVSSNSSSGYNSRTKRQFQELFHAADAINDALSHLVNHVTTDEEDTDCQYTPFPTASDLESSGY